MGGKPSIEKHSPISSHQKCLDDKVIFPKFLSNESKKEKKETRKRGRQQEEELKMERKLAAEKSKILINNLNDAFETDYLPQLFPGMEPIDLRNIFTTFTKKFDNTDQIPPSIFLRVFDNAVNNEKAIRIVTWNVYGKGGTKEFIDLYRRIDADILVLQEVDFSRDKYIIDKFKNQLGYIEHYYASISGRNDSSLGTLLLTKIPATKSYVIPLPQTQKFDSIPERSVLFTLIAGQWFISCHLDGHDKIGELRRLQVSSIFELIDEIIGPNTKKPIIWLGDFNTVRNSDYSPRHLEWQLAQARLAQARSRQKNDKNYIRDIRTIEMITSGQFTRSFGQHSEGKEEDGSHFIEVTDLIKTGGISFTTWTANRVDFIFLKNISPEQIIHFFPVVTPLSDHLPLVLDLLVSV